MTDSATHDAWNLGTSYDAYMGRWSRKIADKFLDWLNPADGLRWLDIGCGTGALSGTILSRHHPERVTGVEPSEGFVAHAQQSIDDKRARFHVGDATALPVEDDSCDAAVSALVLNFVPDKAKALAEMQRATRRGGTIAFYVWDYPGGGMGFIDAFWKTAAALDPAAADLDEANRFPFCSPEGLEKLMIAAGIDDAELTGLEVPTVFRDMEDFWQPFTLGAGPAPGYCMSLSEGKRQALREKLERDLPRADDGSIPLSARAWAVKVAPVS